MTANEALWHLIDLIFPWAQPLPALSLADDLERTKLQQEECKSRLAQLSCNLPELREYLALASDLLATEDDRRSSVDSRLGTIIGLSSLAGSIVFGTMLAASPREAYGWLKMLFAFGPLYLTLQVCSAIHASIKGLARRGYPVARPLDLLPGPNEQPPDHLREQLLSRLAAIEEHRSRNNDKVTQLAVAHRAIQNFVGGLFLLAVVAAISTLSAPSPRENLIHQIKSDPAIRDLLRGPQGPAGPPGSTAPAQETATRKRKS